MLFSDSFSSWAAIHECLDSVLFNFLGNIFVLSDIQVFLQCLKEMRAEVFRKLSHRVVWILNTFIGSHGGSLVLPVVALGTLRKLNLTQGSESLIVDLGAIQLHIIPWKLSASWIQMWPVWLYTNAMWWASFLLLLPVFPAYWHVLCTMMDSMSLEL